jgi:hypothetical protein
MTAQPARDRRGDAMYRARLSRAREASALHAGPTSYSVKFIADSSAPGSVALASIRDP